jgi:hypothetical protein
VHGNREKVEEYKRGLEGLVEIHMSDASDGLRKNNGECARSMGGGKREGCRRMMKVVGECHERYCDEYNERVGKAVGREGGRIEGERKGRG